MKETGGPAFPSNAHWVQEPCPKCGTPVFQDQKDGMTLRDYFAAKAMDGFLASGAGRDLGEFMDGTEGWNGGEKIDDFLIRERLPMVAKWSYAQADAMLKAREP